MDKSLILKSQLSRKKEHRLNILQISFVVHCYLMHSITIIMFGWEMWWKLNFIAIFLTLANFAAFLLDHTKENADVSNNNAYF